MTTTIPKQILLITALLIVSCENTGPGPEGGPDTGEVAPDSHNPAEDLGSSSLCQAQDKLTILDELVADLVADASWAFAHASEFDRAYALSLPGIDAGWIGVASAFMPCTGPVDFDPYCEPFEGTDMEGCLRIGCESATITYAEVYATDGTTQSAQEAMAVSYATSDGGTVDWPVRPIRRWKQDLAASEKTVTASFDADFTVTHGDDAKRFVFETNVSTVESDAGVVSTIVLTFDELGGLGAAELAITHGDAAFEGLLTVGDTTVDVSEAGVDWASCTE